MFFLEFKNVFFARIVNSPINLQSDLAKTKRFFSVSYVYMMENLPGKHRMWIVTVITYSPNYIVFTGLAYLTGEWRLLSRVVAALTIVPGILLL